MVTPAPTPRHARTHVPTTTRVRAPTNARRRPRPFYVGIFEKLRYSYGCVGVQACGRMRCVGVCFFVETLYFLLLLFFPAHTCLLFTAPTIRATTHFTLITARHGPNPSQPWGFFFCFVESFSPCRDQDLAWTPTSTWKCSRMCIPTKRQRAGVFAAGKHG